MICEADFDANGQDSAHEKSHLEFYLFLMLNISLFDHATLSPCRSLLFLTVCNVHVQSDQMSNRNLTVDAYNACLIITVFQGEGDNQTYPARLFHCSNASGRFRVEEVLDFSQEDLEEDDVMILDAWKELFVWVGESARKEEKHEAIKTALVILLLISKELPGSQLAHLEQFSPNF